MFYPTQTLLVIVLLKIVEYVNWVWWVWIEVSVNCGWGLVWWGCEECGDGLCWGVWNVCRCCPHVWCLRFCRKVSAVMFVPVSARQLRALLIREHPWLCCFVFCFLLSRFALSCCASRDAGLKKISCLSRRTYLLFNFYRNLQYDTYIHVTYSTIRIDLADIPLTRKDQYAVARRTHTPNEVL